VNSIVNPDKLRHLGPVADLGAAARAELGGASSASTRSFVSRDESEQSEPPAPVAEHERDQQPTDAERLGVEAGHARLTLGLRGAVSRRRLGSSSVARNATIAPRAQCREYVAS
jgi:hypothetical protein